MERFNLMSENHARCRRLVATGAPVYLAVNPVEYHGPHLALTNDAIVSLGLIGEIHGLLCAQRGELPLLFAGELGVGVEPVVGPGSRPSSFAAVRSLLLTACRSLAELGATTVVLVTFHGSPLHNRAIWDCSCWLRKQGIRTLSPAALVFENFIALDLQLVSSVLAAIPHPETRTWLQENIRCDFHAGTLETSLAMHFAPDSVGDISHVPPCPDYDPVAPLAHLSRLAEKAGRMVTAGELDFAAQAIAWSRLKPFPGYTGRPHSATPEAGRLLAGILAGQAAARLNQVMDGRADDVKPILSWVADLTLQGRLLGH